MYVFLIDRIIIMRFVVVFWASQFPCATQGKNLPQPIPHARHTCIPSLLYSMLLMKLTASRFTGADFAVDYGPLTVTLTPAIPPDDSMAFIICEAVSMSCPALTYILMWLIIVAALRSHELFPLWGSEKSTRFRFWIHVWLPLGGPIVTLMHNDNTSFKQAGR